MPVMAKKPKRSGVPLQLYVPSWIKATLGEMAEEHRRPLTAEVLIALENHIKAAKRWHPPKTPPAADK